MRDSALRPSTLTHGVARRLRGLTRLQAAVLATATILGAAIVVVAAAGGLSLAVALVGLVGVMNVLALLHLRRRIGPEIRSVARSTNDAIARVHGSLERIAETQRRILAATESDRTSAAKRQRALLASIAETLSVSEEQRALMASVAKAQSAEGPALERILEAVETNRVAAADSQDALLARLDNSHDPLLVEQRRLQRQTASVQRDQTREVEALLQLFRDFVPRAPMPSSGGGWAMNATGLLELLYLINRQRPRLILELGSGSSSIWIGYALEKVGGRLVALDHDAKYAEQTKSFVALHRLGDVTDVRLAPLRPLRLDDEDFEWYDIGTLQDVDGVDLLLVDGPPGATGPAARYPALPVLCSRLAANATVILDDVDRPDEQRIVDRWIAGINGLRKETHVFGRQSVLTYSRPALGDQTSPASYL